MWGLVLQTEVTVFILFHDGGSLDGDSRRDQGLVNEHSMSVGGEDDGYVVKQWLIGFCF